MNHVDANRRGLVGAAVMAVWHGAWLLVRAAGQGQLLMDFAFRMHGLKSDLVVEPFEPGMAVMLLVVAVLAGCLLAGASGMLWNWMSNWCERSQAGGPTRA
ncbi:MAG: hypothetical protein FJ284_04520 [Planctomycetes bacterium]|nr:hypothetical protein [Planctomycetota bacterium]